MMLSTPKLLRLALVGASLAFVSTPARAHFSLDAPASYMSQDLLGNPQKAGPCGDDGSGTPTGEVTTYQQGDTVTITLHETIFHPGHYRVALAVNGPKDLPPDPPVTPAGTPCGATEVQSPPVFPILADGALTHSTAFTGPQTISVKLPTDVTCDHCTLQIIEFMSNHGLNNPGGCFYHHCADIKIVGPQGEDAGAGGMSTGTTSTTNTTVTSTTSTATGAGGSGGEGGSDGGESSSSGGCGCAVPGGGSPSLAGLVGLLGAALLASRRRR